MTWVRLPRLAGAALAALAGLPLIIGCDALGSTASGSGTASGTTSPPPASFTVSGRVTALVVKGGSGSVAVTGTAGSTVSVGQQSSYSKTPPKASHVLQGGTLTLSYSCPAEISCSISYQVQVPRGTAVTVSTAAGAITLTALAGTVSAKADAGLINAVGLRSAAATFKSDAGGITASFAAAPRSLTATTDVGPITLTVPGADQYLVATHTYVGTSSVTVARSTSAAHSISARSDLGSISISAG
jgi:hypothetical protein